MKKIIRTLHPEVRIIDAKAGVVDYIASDETVDSYREIIRAKGWRFTNFSKNAPFVDSHNYGCIDRLLGRVIDFRIDGSRLVERVQWAIDVPENTLARIGWKMTEAGYLKAVSVGFYPVEWVTTNGPDRSAWMSQLKELGIEEKNAPRVIYTAQEQIELSACIIGANPNALAKAYKAGALSDEEMESLEKISHEKIQPETGHATDDPADVAQEAMRRERGDFVRKFNQIIKGE